MEWNPKLCISPPLLRMNKRSRGGEQVMAMATSPGNRSVEDKDGFICSPKHRLYSTSALDSQDELMAEDALDSPCTHAEKKRRLTGEQVEFLESSFEKEYKLEPERKAAIAKQLGLQPRQVAVWFQNRRARWKTKQLEIDFSSLKAEYDAVVNENEKLHAEVSHLRCQLKETITHISKSDEQQQLSDESPCSVFHSKVEEEEEEVDSTKFPHYLHVVCLQQPKQELTPSSCVGGVVDISSSQSKSDNSNDVLESTLAPLSTAPPPPNPLVSLVLQETTTLVHVDMDSTPPLSVYSTCEDLFPNPYLFNPYFFQQLGMKFEGANISGLFADDGSSTSHLIFSCDDDTNVYHHNHPPYD